MRHVTCTLFTRTRRWLRHPPPAERMPVLDQPADDEQTEHTERRERGGAQVTPRSVLDGCGLRADLHRHSARECGYPRPAIDLPTLAVLLRDDDPARRTRFDPPSGGTLAGQRPRFLSARRATLR